MSFHAYQHLIHDTAESLGLDEYPYLLEGHQSGLVTLVFDTVDGNGQEAEIVYLGYRRASNELIISQCLDTLDADNGEVRRCVLQYNADLSGPEEPFVAIVADEDHGSAVTFNLCLPFGKELDAEALIGHIGRFMEQSAEFIKQVTVPGDALDAPAGALEIGVLKA